MLLRSLVGGRNKRLPPPDVDVHPDLFAVPPVATAPSDFSRIVVSPPALLPADGLLSMLAFICVQ